MPRSPESFVRARRDSWARLHDLVDRVQKSRLSALTDDELHELGTLYRRASADLARAQTRYSGTTAGLELVRSLNSLVMRAHALIYLAPAGAPVSVWQFFVYGFPEAVRRHRRMIFLSALALYLPAFFAYVAVWTRPDLTSLFIPDQIVQQVKERAQKKLTTGWGGNNDYTGVVNSPEISSEIMTNNIWVTGLSVALGFTAGIGTAFELISNGLMLGALAGVATNERTDLLFWAVILPHGVLELSAISIAGGAGFLIARALYAPGELSHRDSLSLAGWEAAKLMAGVCVMLVIAGTIEGFLTPSVLSPAFKLAFAGFTAIFLGYWLSLKPPSPESRLRARKLASR